MRDRRAVAAVLVVCLMAALALGGCQRKVTMKTGEIVMCTAGEVIEDNTREVEVPADEVDKNGVTTTVITCDLHGEVASLYESAQLAIASGDLETARERLATVVEKDPAYRKAKEQLAAIDAGQTPTPDPGDSASDPGTEPDDDEQEPEPTGPVVSLTKYVPDTISGYTAQGILADGGSLTRQYIPAGGGADQLMIEVEQRVSSSAATSEQERMVAAYPEAQTTRTVGGRSVMAGASGAYAVAVFTDGSVTVAVELHAADGASGASLIDAAFAVVGGIAQ